MNLLSIDDFKKMVSLALSEISARADSLSELDAITGDGDHGTAIVSALKAINESVQTGNDFKTMLEGAGFNVMLATSGSTSTLLGAFFMGMSEPIEGTELNAEKVRIMFEAGLVSVQKNTKASVGDKTMMDALIPAVKAMNETNTDDIKEIFKSGAKAALSGAEATVAMKANFGRARNYGERSIGSADAGATSWAYMFDAFAKAL